MYNDWFRTHLVEGDNSETGLERITIFQWWDVGRRELWFSGKKCKQFLLDGHVLWVYQQQQQSPEKKNKHIYLIYTPKFENKHNLNWYHLFCFVVSLLQPIYCHSPTAYWLKFRWSQAAIEFPMALAARKKSPKTNISQWKKKRQPFESVYLLTLVFQNPPNTLWVGVWNP